MTGWFSRPGPGRFAERAGCQRPLGGGDDRGCRGGQAAGEAAGDQGRLDVGVDVAGRAAGVGHEVEHVGGVAAQAGPGHGAEEPAEGLALVGDERVHEHQGLDLWVADGGVGDDRPAVGVPDQHDLVPGQGRVLGEEVVQVGGVLWQSAQRPLIPA